MTPYAITIATVLISGSPMILLLCWEIVSNRKQAKRSKYKAYVRTTHHWPAGRRHCMFCYVTRSTLEHRMKSDVESLGSLRCMRLERS